MLKTAVAFFLGVLVTAGVVFADHHYLSPKWPSAALDVAAREFYSCALGGRECFESPGSARADGAQHEACVRQITLVQVKFNRFTSQVIFRCRVGRMIGEYGVFPVEHNGKITTSGAYYSYFPADHDVPLGHAVNNGDDQGPWD